MAAISISFKKKHCNFKKDTSLKNRLVKLENQ